MARLLRACVLFVVPAAVAATALLIGGGQREALPVRAAGPTAICGTLANDTWNATGSPYQICASGATIPTGVTVTLDGSGGAVTVQALGSGGLAVNGGTLVSGATVANFTFSGPSSTPGSWSGITVTGGGTVNVSSVTIVDGQYGINASSGGSVTVAGSAINSAQFDGIIAFATNVTASSTTISSAGSSGITVNSASLTLNTVTVNTAVGDGIHFSDGSLTKAVTITNSVIQNAGGYGIYVYGGLADPTISNNSITNSGLTGNKSAAITLPFYTGDFGAHVSGDHGSGNGLDAIGVAGTITGNMTWVNPTNSGVDHPLGDLGIGTLTLSGTKTLTVPQGTVVKFASGSLNVNGATLDATDVTGANNPKYFTTFRDPVGISTCPTVYVSTTCGVISNDWSGIQFSADVSLNRGNGAFANSILRYSSGSAISINSGATTNPSANTGFGLALTNTTIDTTGSDAVSSSGTPVYVSGGVITHSGGRGIFISNANLTATTLTMNTTASDGIYYSDGAQTHAASITNSTVTAATGFGIYVYGGSANPVITGNTVTNSGNGATKYSAIDLPFYIGDINTNVSGDHGSGNGLDAITVAGTFTASATWMNPTNSGVDHPFGYLAIGTVTISPTTTLTVPQGTVVKFSSGTLNLNGGSLNATDVSGADNQKIFTTFRDTAGIATCPTFFISTTCLTLSNDWGGISITQDSGTGARGSASLVNSIVRYSYGNAITISSGATTNPSGLPGYGLTLSNVTLDTTASDALNAFSTPVSVINSQISNPTGRGIYATNGNLSVSGTSVTNAGSDGIYFSDGALTHAFSVTTSNINGVAGYGIFAYGGAANPVISTNSIVNSGNGATKFSAIALPYYVGDLQANVVADHGSGNGLDAIAVAGTVTGNLLWVNPTNSAVDHPFGYLGIGTLNFTTGKTLTLKQGAVVKFSSGSLNLSGASLDATDITSPNNPKVITTFRDPVGLPTCPTIFVSTTCGILSNDWYGISITQDGVSGVRGNAAFNNTTIHYIGGTGININSGATTNPSAIAGYGLVLVNSTVDTTTSDGIDASTTAVYIGGGGVGNTGGRGVYATSASVTVTGATIHATTSDGIYASDSGHAFLFTFTNNTVTGAGGFGIYAYGGLPASSYAGNNITGSGLTGNKSSAIDLPNFLGDLAAATAGDHGSGNGLDAVTVAGTITANLTWTSPTNSGADHAFGILGIGTITISTGMKLTVPQGTVVKMNAGSLNLVGASLDATDVSGPNNPKVFTTFRDTAGLTTCPTVFVSTTCGVLTTDWYGINISQDGVSGVRGSAAFNNATIHYVGGSAISITSGATSNPAGIGAYGLVVMNSTLANTSTDTLSDLSTSVDVTGTTFDTSGGSGVYVNGGTNTFVNDLFQNITNSGLISVGSAATTVVASRFHNIGGTSTSFYAVIASGTGGLTVDCSSIHDNAGGFQSSAAGNQIGNSDLFHNSAAASHYDLFASSFSVVAAHNWWGQAGGPLAGQTGGSGTIDSSGPVTAQTPTVAVQLSSANTNANGTIGAGVLTVTLVFNRKMDPTVAPVVVINPGGHLVTAIGGGTGWQPDGVTWIGTVTVDANFTPGAYTADVSAARSCIPEPATNQMAPSSTGFNVDPTGTATATTTAPTNVVDTGGTLNGTINPNGWTATGRFQYGTTSGQYTSMTPIQAVGNGTTAAPISAALTGLTPFTTYYYRVLAVVGNGITYGAEQTLVTPSILHFPALMNNAFGGYTTTIYLQNKSGSALAAGAITITYFDTSGNPVGTGDSSPALANGAVWVVAQSNGHSFASGGAGSGRVNTSVPVVAFVNQEISGQDGSSYSGLPDPATGSTVFTPTVLNGAYGGYTTAMGITNTGNASTTVTVTYHNPDGSDITPSRTQVLAPNAYWGLYQGEVGTPLPSGFHGTATITSSPAENLAVIVNEVGPGGFLTYTASNAGATTLYAPVVLDNAYGGYNTGMGMMNVTGTTAHVTINYSGGQSESFTIAPRGVAADYNGAGNAAGLPSGFAGSAVITSDQPLVAIVNQVIGNQGTSYNMVSAGVPTIHLPLVENGLNGLSTGLGVENVGTGSATVTIIYYDATTGAQIGTGPTLTLAPGAFAGVYEGPGGDGGVPAGTRATATLTVTNPGGGGKLAVIVNQQSSSSFMSYSGQ